MTPKKTGESRKEPHAILFAADLVKLGEQLSRVGKLLTECGKDAGRALGDSKGLKLAKVKRIVDGVKSAEDAVAEARKKMRDGEVVEVLSIEVKTAPRLVITSHPPTIIVAPANSEPKKSAKKS